MTLDTHTVILGRAAVGDSNNLLVDGWSGATGGDGVGQHAWPLPEFRERREREGVGH